MAQNENLPDVDQVRFNNISESSYRPPLYMLRSAIRSGQLWATWSYRNGVRTIYGERPVVCFTEMPIAAFLESGEMRESRGEAMSQFALIFSKPQLFKLGANPVIYGLDNRSYYPPSGKSGEVRVINKSILPLNEQYRYVTYNPTSSKPIDWTHEREWRWPYTYKEDTSVRETEYLSLYSPDISEIVPALDFYQKDIVGMGIVVKNEKQASWVMHDILVLIDRGIILKEKYKFILVSDRLPEPSHLIHPHKISQEISNSLIDLDSIFSYKESELKELAARFHDLASSIEKSSDLPEQGEFGGCWLWILDNTSKLTRALIQEGRIVK